MKSTGNNDFTILGSGTIITHFANLGLIDTFQIMIDPVALGKGTSIFSGLKKKLDLEQTGSRIFKSGTALLSYKVLENIK
jgi:dihydrofolate reductase